MAPATKKDGVKIVDYSENQGTIGRNSETKSNKGSIIGDHSPLTNTSKGLSNNRRIINYEPYRSASTIGLDIDSSLRPRSPSPLTKNGRHSSVDSCHRTISSPSPTTKPNSIRPGSVASEEIIETKTIEKKTPLLSGVKVMFGVKAKRAPTFPTMPSRFKSAERTTTPAKPTTTSKTPATIVRPTFASRTTNTSTLSKSKEPPSTTYKSRFLETNNNKSYTPASIRSPPLTSSLKKTTTKVSSSSDRENNNIRPASKLSKASTNETNAKSVSMKTNNEPSEAVELTREKAADQSTNDLIPVATWSSGPILISNQANRETSSSYIPGEGKLMATLEEGTTIWKSKTRKVYEEPIKIPKERPASPEKLDRSPERLAITSTDSLQRPIKSKSPDRESSSRTHSPTRYRERSPARSIRDASYDRRSVSPIRRYDSPERPVRHRSPSPIERPSVIKEDDVIDGQRTTRTRFSPSPDTFYRSPNHDDHFDNEPKLLPPSEDLDEVFLRKDIQLNGQEPDQDDFIAEYTPKMEDKACQCNLKRSSKAKLPDEGGLGYRVIKPATDGSVSTYSNVPDISDAETELEPISGQSKINDRQPRSSRSPSPTERRTVSPGNNSEVIYSQIDRTKKRPNLISNSPNHFSNTNYPSDILDQPTEYPDDYLYEANPIKSARPVSPNRSVSREGTRVNEPHRQSSPSPSRSYMVDIGRRSKADSPSPSRPNKTVSVSTKTYGFNMKTALDAPEVNLPARPPLTKPRVIEPTNGYYTHDHDTISRSRGNSRSRDQMREETFSNISSDELVHSMPRRGDISEPDDFVAPKSIIREIDHRKGEINYENVIPGSRNRSTGLRSPYEERVSNGGTNSMWFRSLDDDYRKGMSERDGYNHDADHVTDYCTMSRRGRDRLAPQNADYSPSSMGHAYTLDRRHLDRAKRSKRPGPSYSTAGSHLGISSPMSVSMNEAAPGNNSLSLRKYNSNRDLTNYSSDFGDIGSTRGGLAAAYKARQRRASSLSRYGQSPNGYLPISSSPHHHRTSYSVLSPSYPLHGSHSQLHRLHLSGSENAYPHHHAQSVYHHPIRSSASHLGTSGHYGHSSSESEAGMGSHQRAISGSRSRLHQNDPVVLYIPAISHHHRPVDEDDRNSALGIARTQSILSSSKRSVKNNSTSNKKREQSKERDANFNEITTKVNGYLDNRTSPTGLEGDDEIVELRDDEENNKNKMNGKKNVKRSVSIPKDAKLPWLQKLKMKVKS
uniref:Uncharacterized protein n=1 Tax=Tetranychus urticae TaxID=32264 RepID=T1KCE8_TETUR